jgi:processing peptidase subunit alpha
VHSQETDGFQYKVSRLSNGFTVLTEETSFPSNVHLGILCRVGSRDETESTSGSLFALKNTYLKTLKHTNETINYGMIQMSGGQSDMDFDEETTFYNAHCFEYDTTDIFRMLADIAFEPRSFTAANIGRDKNRKAHKLHEHLKHYEPFANNPQLLLTTAFGYKGLGMPKHGLETNVDNLDSKIIQDFQLANFAPEKTIIVANGVKRHEEFVDLVQHTLRDFLPSRELDFEREHAQYHGGETRTFLETPETNIILGYQSVQWTNKLMPAFAVLHTLFGSATGFSVGGPGKGMLNRAYKHSIKNI